MQRIVFLAGLVLCLVSCGHQSAPIEVAEQAQFFRLTDTLGVTRAEVYDPFNKGALVAQYYLVPAAEKERFQGLPNVITVPVQRVATTSATHIGFLHALGQLDKVVAMSTPDLVYNRPSQAVVSIGEDINLLVEPLLLSEPDMVFVSSYGQNSQQVKRVAQTGIPVVYLSEWMEQHPLARAEWLRFVAAFFDAQPTADSLLAVVSRDYAAVRAEGASLAADRHKTSIVSGTSYRGTWYVPSGTTYMGCLFRDAGADYAFADRRTEGSVPLTMEQALQTFSEADVWVGVNAHSLSELRAIDEKHTWFRAFQTRRVFHFDRRRTDSGGNDFWEQGVVHPEILLRDLQWALYPDHFPDYTPVFIERLEEDL